MYKIRVYSEVCCERCNEIIGNYMDCPVCDVNHVQTMNYLDLYDCINDDPDYLLVCGRCGAKFKLIDSIGKIYSIEGALWKKVV